MPFWCRRAALCCCCHGRDGITGSDKTYNEPVCAYQWYNYLQCHEQHNVSVSFLEKSESVVGGPLVVCKMLFDKLKVCCDMSLFHHVRSHAMSSILFVLSAKAMAICTVNQISVRRYHESKRNTKRLPNIY